MKLFWEVKAREREKELTMFLLHWIWWCCCEKKTITIFNSSTKAKYKTSYVSLESNLYFYIDTVNARKVLSIVDQFAGQNVYDYSTLSLINNDDCFKEFGGCGGCNDSCLARLGKPYLTYDNDGFHK